MTVAMVPAATPMTSSSPPALAPDDPLEKLEKLKKELEHTQGLLDARRQKATGLDAEIQDLETQNKSLDREISWRKTEIEVAANAKKNLDALREQVNIRVDDARRRIKTLANHVDETRKTHLYQLIDSAEKQLLEQKEKLDKFKVAWKATMVAAARAEDTARDKQANFVAIYRLPAEVEARLRRLASLLDQADQARASKDDAGLCFLVREVDRLANSLTEDFEHYADKLERAPCEAAHARQEAERMKSNETILAQAHADQQKQYEAALASRRADLRAQWLLLGPRGDAEVVPIPGPPESR